jgi:ribonuclease-3
VFEQRLAELPDARDLRDSKTQLQEWVQARSLSLPVYELSKVTGKDHKQRFAVTCTIPELSQTTEGDSSSRRKAEQEAAKRMLLVLTGEQP